MGMGSLKSEVGILFLFPISVPSLYGIWIWAICIWIQEKVKKKRNMHARILVIDDKVSRMP